MIPPSPDIEAALSEAEREARARVASDLRPLQREVLARLALGRNVFASLPTGYGKSLCYWAPAAAWGWRTWVVSPLVSLIEDQALACAGLGLEAVALHAGLGAEEKAARERRVDEGAPLVFLSPERLVLWRESGRLRELVTEGRGPRLLALDEMHCFEEWREFRAGYRAAFEAIRWLVGGGAQLLGLSASLSEDASRIWMDEFCDEHERVAAELGRENLILRVFPVEEDSERWLLLSALLRDAHAGESSLVYCATRAECDEVARWLGSFGLLACSYHAGLPAALRAERSRAFRAGLLPVVCATTAFGMGIDFPRVRRVIHFSTPYDLDGYWQEAGRAGRDGRESYACALWRRSDVMRARRMSARQKERYHELWRAWLGGVCRKQAVANSLGMSLAPCGRCDRCAPVDAQMPAWLQAASSLRREDAWWTSPHAEPLSWAREKILGAF